MSDYSRTGQGGFQTDSFSLKVIAIVAMTLNHAGHVFWDQLPIWGRCVLIAPGGLTFPIMAYLLTVGYQHTRDVRRYAMRLAIFAAIALLPFIWAFDGQLNVLVTLLLGLLVIWADDRLENRVLFWAAFAAAFIISGWCDWAYLGVPMIYLYHKGREKPWQAVLPIALVWFQGAVTLAGALAFGAWADYISWYLPSLLYCFVAATATIPLIMAYNGERGRPMKYFFYAYYPAHLALLVAARALLEAFVW